MDLVQYPALKVDNAIIITGSFLHCGKTGSKHYCADKKESKESHQFAHRPFQNPLLHDELDKWILNIYIIRPAAEICLLVCVGVNVRERERERER